MYLQPVDTDNRQSDHTIKAKATYVQLLNTVYTYISYIKIFILLEVTILSNFTNTDFFDFFFNHQCYPFTINRTACCCCFSRCCCLLQKRHLQRTEIEKKLYWNWSKTRLTKERKAHTLSSAPLHEQRLCVIQHTTLEVLDTKWL